MQKVVLKFNAPTNKDLIKKYSNKGQLYNNLVLKEVNLDFVKDFEKNVYMRLVRLAKSSVESVYYAKGLIHLDFTKLITDIEYTNLLKKNGKVLVNHKLKEKYKTDGLFVTDINYYLKSDKKYNYELTYPQQLMNPIRQVNLFLKLLDDETIYLEEKRDEIVKEIKKELKIYTVQLKYNYKTNGRETEEPKVIQNEVKLQEVLGSEWIYIVENIKFNQKSEVYFQSGVIILDFLKLKSNLVFINLLESRSDFKYHPSKFYELKIIKDDPKEYVYLYYKDGYVLDKFEDDFEFEKKIKLFIDYFKRKIRYESIEENKEKYHQKTESKEAYNLAKDKLREFNVETKNEFNKKINFFLREMLLPIFLISGITLFVFYLIYMLFG